MMEDEERNVDDIYSLEIEDCWKFYKLWWYRVKVYYYKFFQIWQDEYE